MSTPEPEPDAYEPPLRYYKTREGFRGATNRKRDPSVPLKGRGLLIGIRGYVREPLKNTVHDATDIAATLDGIGFDEVKLLTDDNDADIPCRAFGMRSRTSWTASTRTRWRSLASSVRPLRLARPTAG